MKKILIIEDEEDLNYMLSWQFKKFGFQTEVALDGETGLQKTRAFHPDIIFLDFILPDMNGLEVCQKLKADPATKNIPIVLVTAAQLSEIEEKAIEFGIVKIFVKPYETSKLISFIQELTHHTE